MRQPNRLDAHGYGPQRAPDPTYQEFRGPYLADDEPWEDFCPGLQASVKRLRLQKLRDASSDDDDDDDDVAIKDDGHTVNLYNYLNTEFAYMTGKAAKSEINIRQLDPSDRARFDVSMQKEWTSWQCFDAVQELSEEEINSLPPETKIIGTRWVHTDKNSKPRLIAYHMARKTGKSKEQVDRDYPFEAKSRLVVQGCQEDEQNIRSDSPTCSLLSFNLVCAVAVLKGWIIASYDASTAYLKSSGISRLLILRIHLHQESFRARSSGPVSAFIERKMPAEVGGSNFHVMLKNVAGASPNWNLHSFTSMIWMNLEKKFWLESWAAMLMISLHVALAPSTTQ